MDDWDRLLPSGLDPHTKEYESDSVTSLVRYEDKPNIRYEDPVPSNMVMKLYYGQVLVAGLLGITVCVFQLLEHHYAVSNDNEDGTTGFVVVSALGIILGFGLLVLCCLGLADWVEWHRVVDRNPRTHILPWWHATSSREPTLDEIEQAQELADLPVPLTREAIYR